VTTVPTSNGPVQGVAVEGGWEFRGIPFAGPIGGTRRFRAAGRPEPWTEAFPADRWPLMAPQPPITNPDADKQAYDDSVFGASYVTDWTEDGLFVNVWTPAPDAALRPVMVWIHGGGFVFGQASRPRENGRLLSTEHDVVVVAPSHRLGGAGYLDTREVAGIEGDANVGLTDIVLALEWVRDNAASFGGDPGNVTVLGESGGAMKVHALLAMPNAEGLFHQAICQSGVFPHATLAGGIDSDRNRGVRDAVLAELGGSEGLLAADADALTLADLPKGEVWQPVHDGVVLPVPVPEATERGACPDVPLMLGTDHDEMRVLRVWMPLPEPGDTELLAAYVDDPAMAAHYGDDVEGAIRDAWFRFPTVRLAEARARTARAPAFLYELRWHDPARPDVGAGHGVETSLVFGNLDDVPFLRDAPGSQELSALMRAAWASFARTGVPVVGDQPWPAYDEERRATVLWDLPPRIESDPGGEERRAFGRGGLSARRSGTPDT
jgi:para-nitrobenzyl esterase